MSDKDKQPSAALPASEGKPEAPAGAADAIDPAATLEQALEHHHQGRFEAAAQAYNALLAVEPVDGR